MTHREKVAILGAGSWGTAVAIHLAHCGHSVLLWGHHPQHVQKMLTERMNSRYLPGIIFPPSLHPTEDLNQCLKESAHTIIAVPSHAFSTLLSQITITPEGLTWLTKGIDPTTNKLLSQLVFERWNQAFPIAILSGPSFAKEVAQFLPTALTLASNEVNYQNAIQRLIHRNNVRIYASDDILGVQLCGAIKNVLAIACGISDGLGFGANTKAALITRGLAEMTRLGIQIGAQEETFKGLAGVGDLVLTCTDNQSRNRRFGLYLGEGLSVSEAEAEINQVVEGKYNANQVCAIAKQFKVEMPICFQVKAVLENSITPHQAAIELMSRSPRKE